MIIRFFLLIVLLAPCISPYGPEQQFLKEAYNGPSLYHPFGQDELGRDLLVRVSHGIWLTSLIALLALSFDILIGVFIGSFAAFSSHSLDRVSARVLDVLSALPFLVIAINLASFVGPGILSLAIALSLLGWIPMAKVVRGEILQLREAPFVLTSKLMGAGYFWILRKHFLPNIKDQMKNTLLLTAQMAIFQESFLSFLGLSVPPPKASLGTLIYEGAQCINESTHIFLFPALALCSFLFLLRMQEPKRAGCLS